jgi:CRISPR-associated protein Cas1
MGAIQVTTQAIQALLQSEVPLMYFSMGGWFYGMTQPVGLKNILWRREQFRMADRPDFCLRLAKKLVAGKIRNQRTMLMRNHIEPPAGALRFLKALQWEAERVDALPSLLGIEGIAARTYFQNFAGMLKVGSGHSADELGAKEAATESGSLLSFDFEGRNRRPPRDPVNALLSLGYSLLTKDLTITCASVGLDPYLGYYHQPRFGRPALALDLMEPFRPLIVDSAVLSAINQRMVTLDHFVAGGNSVALTPEGRKAFFQAYEQRMDTLVTHPLFGYRVSYRRMLEIQTRILARVLTGEIWDYPVFVTR